MNQPGFQLKSPRVSGDIENREHRRDAAHAVVPGPNDHQSSISIQDVQVGYEIKCGVRKKRGYWCTEHPML
jgi:hypothetical protein